MRVGDSTSALARARRAERRRLLREVLADAGEVLPQGGPRLSRRVLRAMLRVPREVYVPEEEASLAYVNRPLPIGHGQTISQPFIVALMTELLRIGPGDRVLEIGTGSGYQAAVLAEIVDEVFTVETVPALADAARRRLVGQGYDNVQVRAGDGAEGWPEEAPFDGIIVTAAARSTPPALLAQLGSGGNLVIPLGGPAQVQWLTVVHKGADGAICRQQVLPVRFVPFT
jgi:protein-L-isoaspartate(D-aspartate) O-methyltransferase